MAYHEKEPGWWVQLMFFVFTPKHGELFQFEYIIGLRWVETTNQEHVHPKKRQRRARRILPQTLQGVKWLWYEEVVKVHELMHLASPWGKHAGLQT